jgi:hypothetical protein
MSHPAPVQAGLMRTPSLENAMPEGRCTPPKATTPQIARTIITAQARRNDRIE